MCSDNAAPNRLIRVGNSPLADRLYRDMSLVQKDIARLQSEMTRLQGEMYDVQ